MSFSKTKEMETFCSTLFHNILNPLTVLSLEIDHQTRKAPTLQTQVDTMIHNLTHLEYFVSLLCEQVRPSSFVKPFSINEEIETAIDIVSYTAKRNNVQLLTLLLHEVSLTGNQLKFHQTLLSLFAFFMKAIPKDDTSTGSSAPVSANSLQEEKVIEVTLEKRKKTSGLLFVLSNIPIVLTDLEKIGQVFEEEFSAKMQVKEYQKRFEIQVRFPGKEKTESEEKNL